MNKKQKLIFTLTETNENLCNDLIILNKDKEIILKINDFTIGFPKNPETAPDLSIDYLSIIGSASDIENPDLYFMNPKPLYVIPKADVLKIINNKNKNNKELLQKINNLENTNE